MELNSEQMAVVNSNEQYILVNAAAGSGKALQNGSIIYTDNGPIKIEEAQVGNQIYGEDGKLHTIIGVYPQGKKQKYIVKFSDGTEINCCNEHLWTFQTESMRSKKSKKYITASLQEIIDNYPIWVSSRGTTGKVNYSQRRNLFIPMTTPVDFTHKEVPLDAYTLGALLGDGSLRLSAFTFTNEDEDVLSFVKRGLNKIDCDLKYSANYDYRITQQGLGHKGTLTSIVENLGLLNTTSINKFIPNIYKYNDIETRLDLLKGLIDTDGYCDGSSYDIVLKSKQLILDIQELCESLGLTAVYQEKTAICTNSSVGKKDCGTVYRLRIKTTPLITKLHKSTKRESQWKPSKVYSHRAIEEIIKTDEYVEMTCIQVDNPTSLFLTNHYIVTHNTRVLTERLKRLLNEGADPQGIVAITFTNNAAGEMMERLGETAKGVFIGTVHSYANYLLLSYGVDTHHYLENEDFDGLFELVKKNPQCVKPVEHLLLDEAQDSTPEQYEFLLEMVNPKNWFLVGDNKQAVFSFAHADVEQFINLSSTPGVKVYHLNNNYRCGYNILQFARAIIRPNGYAYEDKSICASGLQGAVKDVEYKTENLIGGILNYGEFRDWFILCRTNDEIDTMCKYLNDHSIPNTTFKKKDLTNTQLREKLEENTIKVLTIHSAKGLEAKYVAVIGARYYDNEERCVSYVAATRAKELLVWARKPVKRKPRKRDYTGMSSWDD